MESGESVDGDGGDPGGRYEKLRDERPPAGRQGSGSGLAARRASAERQVWANFVLFGVLDTWFLRSLIVVTVCNLSSELFLACRVILLH